MTSLPLLLGRDEIQARLVRIFPEGSQARSYCIRDSAAATVFAMLYVGAIDGTSRYVAPKHVYKMSDEQALLTTEAHRLEYATDAMKPGFTPRGTAWYADTSREPIRDETLRQGFLAVGAATEAKLPTTSPKPRYALMPGFAALFDPRVDGDELDVQMNEWREKHLTHHALMRVMLMREGMAASADDVVVTFPNGDSRRLAPGPSSVITKAVVEKFAVSFIENPAVLWVSESGKKITLRDDVLARRMGLKIDAADALPDIIIVDLYEGGPVLVFIEVVATDGPINEGRRAALLALALDAGFSEKNTAFVTAFMDRDQAQLRNALASLAWNSFVWLASEPEALIALYQLPAGSGRRIHALLK